MGARVYSTSMNVDLYLHMKRIAHIGQWEYMSSWSRDFARRDKVYNVLLVRVVAQKEGELEQHVRR